MDRLDLTDGQQLVAVLRCREAALAVHREILEATREAGAEISEEEIEASCHALDAGFAHALGVAGAGE